MIQRAVLAAALVVGVHGAAAAAPVAIQLELLQPSLVVLDPMYTETAGVDGRTVGALGLGASATIGDWSAALAIDRASATTDFGLLETPSARLAFADTRVEMRWRPPLLVGGWSAQIAAGMGRRTLSYSPASIDFTTGGATTHVVLGETSTWTRHLAAEVLHAVHGNAWIALRTSWTFYSLEVANPTGVLRQSLRDLHVGLALRVHVY